MPFLPRPWPLSPADGAAGIWHFIKLSEVGGEMDWEEDDAEEAARQREAAHKKKRSKKRGGDGG